MQSVWVSLVVPPCPSLQTKIRFSTIIKGTVSTVSFNLVPLSAVNRERVVDLGWHADHAAVHIQEDTNPHTHGHTSKLPRDP